MRLFGRDPAAEGQAVAEAAQVFAGHWMSRGRNSFLPKGLRLRSN